MIYLRNGAKEQRIKKIGSNFYAFVGSRLSEERLLPIVTWKCVVCGEEQETQFPELADLKSHIHGKSFIRAHKKIRIGGDKMQKTIAFKEGDLLIGLKSADMEYAVCNSSVLLKVEQVIHKEFFGDKDIIVSIVAYEHKDKPEEGSKQYLVASKHFRLANDKDKSKFLLNFL
jgi:hypothetical protein